MRYGDYSTNDLVTRDDTFEDHIPTETRRCEGCGSLYEVSGQSRQDHSGEYYCSFLCKPDAGHPSEEDE